MRIRDWSSDVCSSDLLACPLLVAIELHRELPDLGDGRDAIALVQGELWCAGALAPRQRRAWHETVRKVGVIGGDSFRQPLERGKRSEEHTSELQSLMRISYAVFCLKKKNKNKKTK